MSLELYAAFVVACLIVVIVPGSITTQSPTSFANTGRMVPVQPFMPTAVVMSLLLDTTKNRGE
jgi:hypothetical protein